MSDLLLRGGRPWGHDGPADILVRDGIIDRVEPGIGAVAAETVDIADKLILPGFVDAHGHLDKTLYGGPWRPHSAQDSLADRIANERRRRGELNLPNVDYMTALLERMVTAGTTHLRTHTDVDPDVGLSHVDAVREVAERINGRITVTQVAFPQNGLLTNPGTADLLEQALRDGVAAVGGIDPAGVDGDPVRHLDIVFGLAQRHGAYIDIHLHDGGTLGAWQLELIAEATKATGLQGMVTVSHAYAIAHIDAQHQSRIAERLAEAQVTVSTSAVYDFPVPPLKKLLAAGVNIACGNDCIRDLWGPYGNGDMLDRAMHVAYRSVFRRDEDIALALRAATYGGAHALGLSSYGLVNGAPADLVVVSASGPAEAVVTRPPRDLVIKGGRIVGRNGTIV